MVVDEATATVSISRLETPRRLPKIIAVFVGVSGLSALLTTVASLVTARLLGPELLGYWAQAFLIVIYGKNIDFGVKEALARTLPILAGRGEPGQFVETKQVAVSFSVLMAGLAAIATLAVSFVVEFNPLLALAFRVVSLMLVTEMIWSVSVGILKSERRFDEVNRYTLVRSLLTVAGLTLVYLFRFTGYVASALLTSGISCYLIWRAGAFDIGYFRIELRVLRSLLVFGLPLIAYQWLMSIFQTFDRAIIATHRPPAELGYYTLGVTLGSVLAILSTYGSVLYPTMAFEYGERYDRRRILRYIGVPTGLLSIALPPLLGMAYLALPLAVELILPAYLPAIDAARVFLLAGYYIVVHIMAVHAMIMLNRRLMLVGIVGVCTGLLTLTAWILAQQGADLHTFALLRMVGTGLLCSVIVAAAAWSLGATTTFIVRLLALMHGSLVGMMVFTLALARLEALYLRPEIGRLAALLVVEVALIVVVVPILVFGLRGPLRPLLREARPSCCQPGRRRGRPR